MTDPTTVIHDLVEIFDQLRLPYAIMGGIAGRAHGIPRPTYDLDFTLGVEARLDEVLAARECADSPPWTKPSMAFVHSADVFHRLRTPAATLSS